MDCDSVVNVIKVPQFVAYWGGYFKAPTRTLDKIPSYINVVYLAFVGCDKNSGAPIDFLCSIYDEDVIKSWVKELKSRGQKVMVSLLDRPECHWDVINLKKYAKNVKILVDEWDLDGVDIDVESGMSSDHYVKSFVGLIKELKNVLNNGYDDKLISYTCYEGTQGFDGQILPQVKEDIDWLNTMAYFDNFDGMIELFNDYSTIIDSSKINIGVKAGHDGEDQSTPLAEVIKLCKWQPNEAQGIENIKGGMMLWTTNRDGPDFTKMKEWTYCDTINHNLLL